MQRFNFHKIVMITKFTFKRNIRHFAIAWFAVLFGVIMPQAILAYDFEVNHVQYTIMDAANHTVAITGNSLSVPTALNIATVNYNGESFIVDSIGIYAFKGCSFLTSVTFPEATIVGKQAFFDCDKLTSATFPKATVIGNGSFQNSGLATASFPLAVTIENGAFIKTPLTSVSFPKAQTIGFESFCLCTSLISAAFPNVKSIESQAFYQTYSLNTLYLGSSVPAVINDDAFDLCPKGNLYIINEEGNAASTSAYSSPWKKGWIVQSSLPATSTVVSITGVPTNIERTTNAPKNINLDASVAVLPSKYTKNQISWSVADAGTTGASIVPTATAGTTLTVSAPGILVLKATIIASEPDYVQMFPIYVGHAVGDEFTVDGVNYKVTSIADENKTVSAIGNTITEPKALNISTVTDGGEIFTVTAIGNGAFQMSPITSANFPNVETIGDYAFVGSNITSANFVNAKSIGERAFFDCEKMTTAIFPEAIIIKEYAFESCIQLITLTFTSATTVEQGAFHDCRNLKNISFPNVTSLGTAAFHGCENLKSAAFPNVKSIEDHSFAYCDSLGSLSLGASLSYVSGYAFTDGLSPRYLTITDNDGTTLTGAALNEAIKRYKNNLNGFNSSTGLWFGWTLPKYDVSGANVYGVNDSYEVGDEPIRPKIALVIDGRTLVEGTDYDVTYGANNKVGKGTVSITGKGNYGSSMIVTFIIETKKYAVTLPTVKNAVINPAAGTVRVEEGKDFVFTVTPEKGYVAKVTTDQGETLYPFDNNHYMIVGLKWDTKVNIEVLKSTAAEDLNKSEVWSKDGNIFVLSPTTEHLTIVNILGKIAKSIQIPSGTTMIGGLTQGVYIVRAGTTTCKVVVQ